MFSLRFRVKLLFLLLLGIATLGSNSKGSVATAVSCGKCDFIYQNGQLVGYACIHTGTHGCTATTEGCDFTSSCDDLLD